MRRPDPLPARRQEQEHVEVPISRSPLFDSRSESGTSRPDDERTESDRVSADTTGHAEDDSITAVIEDAVPDAAVSSSPVVRTGDVWRAARARRKALRAEIRRFTQRSRRRRITWWSSVGAILALVLGSVIAAYSPLFSVEKITVAGVRALDAAEVQRALSAQLGSPLALVDARAVKSALTEFPMIESYALEARPPHELLVRIIERTPVGVIGSDAGYTLVDAAGVVLATTPQRPDGQPVLSIIGGTDSAAFRSAGLVIRSLPGDLRAQVAEVKASSSDDVTLVLKDGKTVLWGSEDDSVTKAIVLGALIKNAPESHAYDVSAPTAPVVR